MNRSQVHAYSPNPQSSLKQKEVVLEPSRTRYEGGNALGSECVRGRRVREGRSEAAPAPCGEDVR